ncbi:winged helix-turn-helix transcriptional regulator [Actinoallomurus acanthiterrae]
MLGKTYEGQNCSAARALEVVGERWSLLIMRDAIFRGTTRFTEFQRILGIAPNILANRLDGFVAAGLMTIEGRDYRLTTKGLDLQSVIVALTEWGDRWAAPSGPPILYRHDGCGGHVCQKLYCADCGTAPNAAEVTATPGPGTGP